jgi:hypothetical protein
MKGKLIKKEKGFALVSEDKTQPIGSSISQNIGHKLSIKNCEAIERGYDLDELADDYAEYMNDDDGTSGVDFEAGFQKALEILGDKKFNQNDVLDVVNHVLHEMVLFEGFDKQYLFPESVYHEVTTKCQSIQQNEWDVEIVMEEMPYSSELSEEEIKNLEVFVPQNFTRPKLDSEGCLILKRI